MFEGDAAIAEHLHLEHQVASALTFAEAMRALRRQRRTPPAWRALIEEARARCEILPIDDRVLARVAASFPVEPLRTLDAIHLASATLHAAVEPVTMLSTDARIRENARALGLEVLP